MLPGVVCFRYIPKNEFDSFRANVGTAISDASISTCSSDSYWDYPNVSLETLNQSDVLKRHQFKSDLLELKSLKGVLIDPVPEHLKIRYILMCQATLLASLPACQGLIQELLGKASLQLKEFTDLIAGTREHAPFRPTVWFLPFEKEQRGLEGVLRDIPFPPFPKVYLERIFSPVGDYVVYGVDFGHEEVQKRIIDLSLALLAPHILERGLRPMLLDLLDKARTIVSKFDPKEELPYDVVRLDQIYKDRYRDLMELVQISREATTIHETVVRIGGMVRRIRQKQGGQPNPNVFDLICGDALTIVKTESDALVKLVTGWNDSAKAAIDSIFAKATQLHNVIIQKVGWALQAVAAAFVIFQIADKVLPVITYRSLVIVLLTGGSWVASYAYLNKGFRQKLLKAVGDC